MVLFLEMVTLSCSSVTFLLQGEITAIGSSILMKFDLSILKQM